MQISVIGTGYLGATHAACMAQIGHSVLGVDIDADKPLPRDDPTRRRPDITRARSRLGWSPEFPCVKV